MNILIPKYEKSLTEYTASQHEVASDIKIMSAQIAADLLSSMATCPDFVRKAAEEAAKAEMTVADFITAKSIKQAIAINNQVNAAVYGSAVRTTPVGSNDAKPTFGLQIDNESLDAIMNTLHGVAHTLKHIADIDDVDRRRKMSTSALNSLSAVKSLILE